MAPGGGGLLDELHVTALGGCEITDASVAEWDALGVRFVALEDASLFQGSDAAQRIKDLVGGGVGKVEILRIKAPSSRLKELGLTGPWVKVGGRDELISRSARTGAGSGRSDNAAPTDADA